MALVLMVLLLVLMILACVLMVLALVMKVLTALALMLMTLAQSYHIFTDGFWGYLSNLKSLLSQSLTHSVTIWILEMLAHLKSEWKHWPPSCHSVAAAKYGFDFQLSACRIPLKVSETRMLTPNSKSIYSKNVFHDRNWRHLKIYGHLNRFFYACADSLSSDKVEFQAF